jgi:Protein of unknown function (DUF2800)
MERFSASKAARIMSCSASGNLEVAIPHWNPPTEDRNANTAANRGTHMHEILADITVLPPKEMAGFAKAIEYIAEVRSRRRFTTLIEQTETSDWLTQPEPTTADLVLFTQDEIHVLDFKWGKIPVEVVDNQQLLYYAATYAKYAPKAVEVVLHIVQPNAGLFTSWTVDTVTLADFMRQAIAAQDGLLAGNLAFLPGDHCTFCAANPHSRGAKGSPLCPAMMQMLYPAPFDEAALLEDES